MGNVRILAALVAVLFALQLVAGGVQRRDTTSSSSSDPLQGLVDSLVNSASELRTQIQGIASNNNTTAFFDEVSRHLSELQNKLGSLAANVSTHFNGTPAPPH